MMRATIFSCAARPVVRPLKASVGVKVEAPIAVVTCPCASTERLVTRLYSFSSMWVRVCCASCTIADFTVLEPKGLLARLLICTAPPVLTWYCSAVSPDRKTALPATEMQVNSELVFWFSEMSPISPPQPTVEPAGESDCQVDCWSMCENSFGGIG